MQWNSIEVVDEEALERDEQDSVSHYQILLRHRRQISTENGFLSGKVPTLISIVKTHQQSNHLLYIVSINEIDIFIEEKKRERMRDD